MREWLQNWLFQDQLKELAEIEAALDKKLEEINAIYTTIRTFKGLDREYYGWVCALLERDEYRFMLFDLRENVIKELSLEADKEKAQRHLGRLDMLNIIDNYLKQYKREYEDSIRGNTKNTENR